MSILINMLTKPLLALLEKAWLPFIFYLQGRRDVKLKIRESQLHDEIQQKKTIDEAKRVSGERAASFVDTIVSRLRKSRSKPD